jgi:type IV pilus assembly protein PilM
MSFTETFFKYFPTPKFLQMSHAGIDLSPTTIRFVELHPTMNGVKLSEIGNEILTTPITPEEMLAGRSDLTALLKKIRRANGLVFVEVAIPEDKGYIFTTEIPEGDENDVRTHIEFHLEENVPIPLADAVYDYFVIPAPKNAKGTLASVSVVPQVVLEDRIKLCESAGLIPVSFLIENQALARSLYVPDDTSTSLAVNFDDKKTVMSIISRGTVLFTSTVPIGGEDFTSAIMKNFNISKEEAEKTKFEKGFTREKENEGVLMALINAASALKDEMSRISVYWNGYCDKNKQNPLIAPIEKIVLAGHDAAIIGFREYVSVSMNMEVSLANVWSNVLSFDKEIPSVERNESLDYGVAIGLALPKIIQKQI